MVPFRGMNDYTFCETVLGFSRMHIRRLVHRVQGRFHIKHDAKTLCGLEPVRDLTLEINGYYLDRLTCTQCKQAYLAELEKADIDG